MLGKRKAPADLPSPRETRSKRRALQTCIFEDNDGAAATQQGDESRVEPGPDENDDPFVASSKRSKPPSRPAKHAAARGRVPLSPTKGNEQRVSEKTSSPQKSYLATPQTPRHHDVLSKTSTPKHRVLVAPKLPFTPRTPQTPRSTSSLYNSARQLFARGTNPGQLIGRERERDELKAFLDHGVQNKSGRCLYVSGPPGTGKSAVLGEVCRDMKDAEGVCSALINCMSIRTAKDLYATLVVDLCPGTTGNRKDDMDTLKTLVYPKRKDASPVYVVTLDEIDHLLTLDLSLLYNLFEWALDPKSSLIMIGIANALDFTDRFLPRLKARGLKPRLLPFLPYTAPQIASVITGRLTTLRPADAPDAAFTPFVHPSAIQFTAKKVAAQTGDLRKAFDMVRRALDVVEGEAKAAAAPAPPTPPHSSPLGENPNLRTPQSSSAAATPSRRGPDPLAHLTPCTAPRATIAHLARLAATTFNHGTAARLATLTLQQKAALCALVSREKRAAARWRRLALATPSKSSVRRGAGGAGVREAWDAYRGLCAREAAGRLAPLSRVEFGEVLEGLEQLGLVGAVGGREAGGRGRKGMGLGLVEEKRVESRVTETEMRGCLEGVEGEILRRLLVDDDDDRED